jgi:thymidine kinase
MKQSNEFVLYVGPMMATKTSKLLMCLDRYKYQNKRIIAFKPLIDTRYASDEIISHGGLKASAVCINVGADLLKYLSDSEATYDVIAVDEAFMINGVADALIFLYRSGFTIIVSSLNMSALCKPFKEVEQLMPWATYIEKCSSVCTICGGDAHYTYKKQINEDEVVDGNLAIAVGGGDLYEPRCTVHHPLFKI